MKKAFLVLFLSGVAIAATPYMRIEKPLVQPAGDPAYDTKLDTGFNVIDAHDHSTSKGVQLKSAALAGVSTQHFADGSVTNAKLLPQRVVQESIAGSLGSFNINRLPETDLTGTTAAVTDYTLITAIGVVTSGRPIEFGFTGHANSACRFVQNRGSAGSCSVKVSFLSSTDGAQDFFFTYDAWNELPKPCSDLKQIVPVSGAGSAVISVYLKGVSTSMVDACAIENGALWGEEI